MLIGPSLGIILLSSALILIFTQHRFKSSMLLLFGYGLLWLQQQITSWALIPLGLLLLAAVLVRGPKIGGNLQTIVGHLLFIGVSLLLMQHQFPGFHNFFITKECLTANAASYALYLNSDKPLIGFWILLTWPPIKISWPNRSQYRGLLINAVITMLGCSLVALRIKMVGWAPKWPWFGWVWVINNLLLVSMTEEAFFRGYLQEGIRRWLGPGKINTMISIIGCALLFGLAHYAGGWYWVVLASLAAVGYGFAYHFAGWQAAVITHFVLNLLHFICLTYPQFR